MILRLAAAAALLLSVSGCVTAPPSNGECNPEASSFGFGTNSTWLLVVGPKGCSDTLDLSGGFIVTSSVVQQAQNGTAFMSGASYGYTPRPGYVGADQFKLSLTGQGNAGQATSIVTVRVKVVQ